MMDKPEFVYFILASNSLAVKIGKCNYHPDNRLKTFQTGTPEPLILIGYVPGGVEYEKRIQKKLVRTRIRGEWFQLDDTLRRFFKTLGIWHEVLDTLPDYEEHWWNCDPYTGFGLLKASEV